MKKTLVTAILCTMTLGSFAQVIYEDENGVPHAIKSQDELMVVDTIVADTTDFYDEYYDKDNAELEQAFKEGDLDAGRMLVDRYRYGEESTPETEAKVLETLTTLAEKGNAYDKLTLGLAYLNNDNSYYDEDKGLKWLQKAEKEGSLEAGVHVAEIYLEDPSTVKKGLSELEKLAKESLKEGDFEITNAVASIYDDKECSAYDPQKALELRIKEIEGGFEALAPSTAEEYIESGSAEDLDIAMRLCKMVPDMPEALLYMGDVYANKNYSQYNLEEAMKCYQKAAEQDYSEGWQRVAILYKDGYNGKPDLDKAMEAIDKALEINEYYNYYETKGEIYALQGNKEKALEIWNNIGGNFYVRNNTPLNQYIHENFSELTYENQFFKVTYPIDYIREKREDKIAFNIGENMMVIDIEALDDDELNNDEEAYAKIHEEINKDPESANVQWGEPTTINLDGISLRQECFTADLEGHHGTFKLAFHVLKEKHVVMVIALMQTTEEGEKLEKILDTFKWK